MFISPLPPFRTTAVLLFCFLLICQPLAGKTREEIAVIIARAENSEHDFQAKRELALMYLSGSDVPQDTLKAVKLLRSIDEWTDANKSKLSGYVPKGTADIQCMLGEIYANGDSRVPRDPVEAVRWFRKASEYGNSQAQNNLAFCYANGIGVAQDYVQAATWARKSAEQGDPEGQHNLGYAYQTGRGVEKDLVLAAQWWHKAAAQGNALSQVNLGINYATGQGVTKDLQQAVAWYRKAAEQGNSEAERHMGFAYQMGAGVVQDIKQSAFWYRKAAEQGDEQAQHNLGFFYATGQGVSVDIVQASYWWRKASEQGYPDSMANMGLCYLDGQGVTKDEVEAYAFFKIAGVTITQASKELAALEKKFSKREIEAGDKRASELQAQIAAKLAGK